MQRLVDGLPSPLTLLRVGLVVFVLVWLFGPYALRSAVPIWLPFLIALGLELHFFVGGLRPPPARRADRGPQADDIERYGYADDAELLLVREGDEEHWIPYSGETDEELSALIAEARENQRRRRRQLRLSRQIRSAGGFGHAFAALSSASVSSARSR